MRRIGKETGATQFGSEKGSPSIWPLQQGLFLWGKRGGVSDWGSSTREQATCPRTPQPSKFSFSECCWSGRPSPSRRICTAKTKAKRMLFGAFPNQQFDQVTTVTDEPCHHPKVSIQLLKSFPLKYEQMTMDHSRERL